MLLWNYQYLQNHLHPLQRRRAGDLRAAGARGLPSGLHGRHRLPRYPCRKRESTDGPGGNRIALLHERRDVRHLGQALVDAALAAPQALQQGLLARPRRAPRPPGGSAAGGGAGAG